VKTVRRPALVQTSRRGAPRQSALEPRPGRRTIPLAELTSVSPEAILEALERFTARERIELPALAAAAAPVSEYPPLHKYVLDLKNGTKPETAAEDLFVALCREVLGLEPTRQVGLREGYVDFMLPERSGEPIPLELKPLFLCDGPDRLRRADADPGNHLAQVRKYLRDREYLVLTDLRTAWCFSTRDFFFEHRPFAQLPLAELLRRCRQTRSVLDTLRHLEDTADKPELEQQFFEDLQIWFEEFAKVRWTPPELATESIILLLNKLIFARTLEDFGLVQHGFMQEEYARFTRLWEPKGAHRVVPKFLDFFEGFFDEYYDTEIFAVRIWDRLDKAPENLRRFAEKLNFALGVHTWDQAGSRGIVHYNYRRIDEDIFGKSYEMFLAANRKDAGIYYTPASITTPMADALVDALAGPLVDAVCAAVDRQSGDFARADSLMAQLAEIRVADTACGSGGFLIKVLRAFWRQYQRIEAACAWVRNIFRPDNGELFLAEVPPGLDAALAFRRRWRLDDRRLLIAQILLRHVFGVDKDPGALEVAKTNIWKEAVKLAPSDYNYRLLGTDVVRILPNLELNFLAADSLVDLDLARQTAWLAEHHAPALRQLATLRARYVENPMDHAPLDEALALRQRLYEELTRHPDAADLPGPPAGFALRFWPAWFTPDGRPRTNPGFDGLLGNPPWEGFKAFRKEFAAAFHRDQPRFQKMGMDTPAFDRWFEAELKANPEFAARWREYEAFYERHSEFFRRRYRRQGTGDLNLFKLFIESDLALLRAGGRLSLLVPSGLQTDEGCAELRRWLITEHRLEELTSFENRGYKIVENGQQKSRQIFPDVDSRFKFGFFKLVKGEPPPPGHTFAARFYLHDPREAAGPAIRYDVDMIRRFSPENLSIMEFRHEADYRLCARIRGEHPLMQELEFQLANELHLTNDARFFHKLEGRPPARGELPLYEGKMIWQYDAHFQPARWCVREAEVRQPLLRKEVHRAARFVRDNQVTRLGGQPTPDTRAELEARLTELFESGTFKLAHEFERLGTRDVGSSTNERTLIGALIPARVCLGNTINFVRPFRYVSDARDGLRQQPHPREALLALLALLNSLVLNFYVRNKVSAHVNMHQLYELPMPALTPAARRRLANRAGRLLENPHDVPHRAALEVFIARDLYGLSREDWQYLTGTFTYGSGDSKAELDEILRQSLTLWAD
jgi:hypothetical protein